MKKTLLLLLFLNYFTANAQQKRSLSLIPSMVANSNYRVGCSLFTDPNNFTSGSSFSYNAPVNNNSNLIGGNGTNYGCMGSIPNQAWFIITVNTGGNLYFNFSNSNNYDVDAIVWGPIANSDVANACNTTQNYPITCDYDAARPDLNIYNAQAGQKYVMLVTNYSNANTVINISQPSGGSVTYSMVNLPNCALTPTASISGTSTTINEGQSATLSLNFTGSSPWNYTLSDGTVGTSYSSPTNVTVYPTASQTYTINSVNNLCGTSGGSGSVGISVVRNVQLKSCFPLDGNANDSQGLNTGSLQNGTSATTNRSSEANKALQFDGIDDYVNIPTNQLTNNTFAFSAWVKLDELPNGGNTEQLALSLGSTGEQHYIGVEYANGNSSWKFYSNGVTVYGNATVNTEWHLMVGVRTGGQLKLYIDGTLTGTSNTIGAAFYDSPLFGRIGSGIANNKFFKGKIDDVKIFNGSLIEPEVLLLQNYNSCNNVYNDTFISVQSISTSVICTGVSFIIRAFTNNLPIENDLQFVAELSDANGNFSNPTAIGSNTFLPLTVSIPNNIQGGNYKIRVRYGGTVSVNTFDIFVNNPSTYNVSGTVALNDGQSTNVNLNFTGTGPWNYVLSNGLSGVATTNPWQITVTPDQSTVYSVTSASNVCGTTTLNGNNSAIVSVNFTKQFVTCLPFSNNANDENNNNTATVNGPILVDNRYGQINAAYNFNGSSNYIEYTTNLLRKREYTMSAWVLSNSIPGGTQYIISQGETGTNTFQGLAITGSGWVFQSYTSNGVYSVSSTTGLAANQWIHLTAVCSYQSLKLYVNGNLVSTASNSSFIPFKTSDIGRIGANSSSLGNYFNGKIDDVRLYKGALNDDEVYAMYNNTNNCPVVENNSIIVVRNLSPTSVCAGNNISVSYTLSNVNVSAGSPLNVLLSDVNGSFANPTIIGSGLSSPITATIPNNTVNSSFYRIRLVSTSGTPVTSINSSSVAISGSRPTATVSGGGSIQNGQSANITITFTGIAPWTYSLNNGSPQTTSTSPLVLPVSPFSTTIYTITTVSNACGTGTSSGSATVTVAPYISLGSLYSSYCTGVNYSVAFQTNFTPNNNFRVELSDAVGNFSSPINIGVGTNSPITAQIPNSVLSGTGYKIRIVSDNPVITSATSGAFTITQGATATISGSTTINEGQSTNLTITFTGQGPWTYSINNGASLTTNSNTIIISVSPIVTTTYTITSFSNPTCGAGLILSSASVNVVYEAFLISCYSFNGNANDSKGGNHGTQYGGVTLTTDRFNSPNSAFQFDGVDDYIQIPTNGLENTSNYSFSVWINLSNIPPIYEAFNIFSIVPSSAPYHGNTHGLAVENNPDNPNNPVIRNTYPCFSNSQCNLIFGDLNKSILLNSWYNLVVTRQNNIVRLYMNGIMLSDINGSPTNSILSNFVGYIGKGLAPTNFGSGNYNFKGKIDDLKIFKRALSSTQVYALYNQTDCQDITTEPLIGIETFTNTTLCRGQNKSIPYTVHNNVQLPIKAQLSDASGSFSSPLEIGSGNSTPISIQIPANQMVGSNYKIRLISSNNSPIISNIISNISVNAPVTAIITGTATINEGVSTNLTINFTGTPPFVYTISGGTSQTTSNNPLVIPVSPIANTTYTIASLSNACGNSTGSGSAEITVIQLPVNLLTCIPINGLTGINVTDSKNLNNGTIYGNPATIFDRYGNAMGAVAFNGNDTYLKIPTTRLSNQDYTHSFWFNPSLSSKSTMDLFSIVPQDRQALGHEYKLNQLQLPPNWDFSYSFTISIDGGSNNITISNLSVTFGQWYNFVLTRSANLVKIYLNGLLLKTTYVTGNVIYPNSPEILLGGGTNQYTYFQGSLDDIQIYKGALTAEQVQALYNNTNACFNASTYTCLSNITYNSILSGQQVLQVSNQIIGSSTIQTGSNIYFDSKNSVLLQPGFKTEGNAVFKATAGGGCN